MLLELISKLDTSIQIRGRQFEHICKWYLENDPKYRLELKNVWLWKDWTGRWGPDCGIDLIAKGYDGKVWAIQAKAYDKLYPIKKADIDTFLSESSRPEITFRLLISTTNLIGKTAQRTIESQEKKIGLVLLSNLMKSEIEWPDSPDELLAKPPKPKTPQPHQVKAIDDVVKGFSENDRGQLIMACGTGKTLVSLWLAEKLDCQRTLILLPSLSLLAQTLGEWTVNTLQEFHYLPVCSDDTVRGEDHFTSHTSELGLPVTTDPAEVAAFLRKKSNLVVFSTYQSSPVIAKVFAEYSIPGFDLAIADEAHRCTGIGKGPFVTILDSGAIKVKKRLFMTATPRYFTDKVHQEAGQAELDIASMDDESKFGPVFHQLNFSEAIEQELLCDYQVVIIGIDNTTYLKYAESGMFITTDGKYVTDARTLASHIALVKAMRKYDLRKVISFHSRIKRAKKFSDELPDVIEWMPEDSRPTGSIWSKHVSGYMSSGKRDALLSRFRHLEDGERGLLSNARCLGEGVDVPTLDGVAFIDPRNSQLDIVQAVGRAIRKAPNKKIGTVVLPVFVSPDKDHEIALDSSAFKPVWNVLKALRAHDNVISESLDQLRRQIGQRDNTKIELSSKLFIDMPVTIGKTFVESLHVKLVEHVTASWEFFFGLLQQYIEDKGHAIVPRSYITKNGYKLGQWVSYQQSSYRKRKLLHTRQTRLEQLPDWIWDHSEALWQEGYKRLCEYVKREGHPNVPLGYITEDDFNLGPWVHSQHDVHSKGKLSKERQTAIEKLPGWAWRKIGGRESGRVTHRQEWTDSFIERLREYAEREGHTNVPEGYFTKDNYSLGKWVRSMRADYSLEILTEERKNALEQIKGWVWHIHKTSKGKYRHDQSKWLAGFQCMCEYAKREGQTQVPGKYITEDGYRLGAWVQTQRQAYRKKRLSIERIETLEKLASWVWSTRDKKISLNTKSISTYYNQLWQEGYKHLVKFIEHEGHTAVPRKYITEDGFKLGNWVSKQRSDYSEGKLPKNRQKALESTPRWVWKVQKEAWQEGYKHLVKFIEQEGHPNAPRRYIAEDGYKLGLWVMEKRQRYKQGKLSREQKLALEKLRRWSWNGNEGKWFEQFELLHKYVKREGQACAPSGYLTEDGYKLGTWVIRQQYLKKKGELSKKKQELLENLPGWIWERKKSLVVIRWNETYELLKKFCENEGHARVHQHYKTEDNYPLGVWVGTQRAIYKNGQLSKKRQELLEKLPGWVWDARKDRWPTSYKYLCDYATSNGTSRVPSGYTTEDGFGLGKWVTTQRAWNRKGLLTTERQKKLEKLPDWTWGGIGKTPQVWQESLRSLIEYAKEYGNTNVPSKYKTKNGFKLGQWVSNQRQFYKKGKLSPERIKDLEKLNGWLWDARKSKLTM